MATVDQIQASIALGQSYYLQLLDANTANRQVGLPDMLRRTTTCLRRLMLALGWDLADSVNDAVTTVLYELLNKEIVAYNGAGLAYDPTVIIPGGPVIIAPATPIIPITKQASDLVLDVDIDQYYLPFLDNSDQPITNGQVPVGVLVNGQTMSFTFAQLDLSLNPYTPPRIYSFANNSAPQDIVVISQFP